MGPFRQNRSHDDQQALAERQLESSNWHQGMLGQPAWWRHQS
jgi:hypothetical protein